MTDRLDEVIRDEFLRRLAQDRSAAAAHVLIEVAPPTIARLVRLGRQRPPISGQPGAVTVTVPSGDGEGPPLEAARAVAEVLGRRPHYLRAAHAFVSDVTGAQLAALAASPEIRAIRPCRRVHHRRAAKGLGPAGDTGTFGRT
jgi:hypothetical protein